MNVIVALLVTLALPVGGVRTNRVEIHCCCPIAAKCKCPSHELAPDAPSIQKCHRTLETFATPVIPAFASPVQLATEVARVVAVVVHAALASPRPPPLPRRPDAPS